MIEILAKGFPKNVEEAVIRTWFFEEGDHVAKGDDLAELATADDVVIIISAPKNGVIAEVYFDEGESVQRDEVLCSLDAAEKKLKAEDDDDGDSDGDDAEDDESEDDY